MVTRHVHDSPRGPMLASMTATPPVVPNPTNAPKAVASWIADIVNAVHKEAALVLGVLTAMGVTPVPASESKLTSSLLIGYAAVTQIAAKFGVKL